MRTRAPPGHGRTPGIPTVRVSSVAMMIGAWPRDLHCAPERINYRIGDSFYLYVVDLLWAGTLIGVTFQLSVGASALIVALSFYNHLVI